MSERVKMSSEFCFNPEDRKICTPMRKSEYLLHSSLPKGFDAIAEAVSVCRFCAEFDGKKSMS